MSLVVAETTERILGVYLKYIIGCQLHVFLKKQIRFLAKTL